jgi:hypothetical protein
VFSTLVNFKAEYRIYRRDENGHIVKQFDHLMDDMRYLIMSGLDRAKVRPVAPTFAGQGIADARAGY